MKKIAITLFALLAVGVAEIQAQAYSGLLASIDGLTVGDIANTSQTQFQYGTARNMAMAGALSSLGADVSVMATNPAGLGMFSKSEISVTPMITAQSSRHGMTNYMDNTKTTFSMGNVGMVATIPTSTSGKGLLSFTIGFAYNRLTDLNFNTSFQSLSFGRESSIGKFFANQLNDGGFTAADVEAGNESWSDNVYTDSWGAALGYQIGMVSETGGVWSPSWIADNANIGHYVTMESRGSVGEYDIALGANVGNKLYIGATVGIVSLNQQINYIYSEDYTYPENQAYADYEMDYMHYNQTAILDGVGVNFKMGIIYRPVNSLRLSFAVHTPSAFSVDREYQGAAASLVRVSAANPEGVTGVVDGYADLSGKTPLLYDEEANGWYYSTPTRIIAGAAYQLGNRAVLSFDYQRDWNNRMRVTSAPYGINTYNYERQAEADFKATNTFRFGGEFKVTPAIALRAGYGLSSSIAANDDIVYASASPVVESTNYFSAGVGFAVNKQCSIDFAYMRHITHYTDFQLYGINGASLYSLDIVRNNFAVTTSIKW